MRPLCRIFAIGLLLAGGALAAAPAPEATSLRYRFKEGEKLNYVMVQKQEITMNVNGADTTFKSTQTIYFTWTINAVDKDGAAKISQRIDRARMSMDAGQGGVIDFDTKDGKEPDNPAGAVIVPILKAMAGSDFTLTMSTRGEISDVVLPKKVLDALQNLGTAGGAFTPDTLKQMPNQGSLVLPKDAVKKGDSWNDKLEVKADLVGKMVVDTKATYEGETTKDGKKLHSITLKPTMTIEAPANAAAKITLKDQNNKGAASFDGDKGRLVDSNLEQNIEMDVVACGQTVTMKMKQNFTLKLAPDK
jgi:hypothetical protein